MVGFVIQWICRSTIVHSNTVAPKDQPSINSLKDRQNAEEVYSKSSRETEAVPVHTSRTLQAQQRFPLGIF